MEPAEDSCSISGVVVVAIPEWVDVTRRPLEYHQILGVPNLFAKPPSQPPYPTSFNIRELDNVVYKRSRLCHLESVDNFF